MSKVIFLDTGPLAKLIHPNVSQNAEITAWVAAMLEQGHRIVVPEISDYELRRELLLRQNVTSVERLNDLKLSLEYMPLSTTIMLRAAALWAQVRLARQPTADRHALDGDVILAAQVMISRNVGLDSVVATENVGHLSRFVDAKHWRQWT